MIAVRPPDYRHGYLRIPLATWLDVFCRAPLTRRQLQLVSVVMRETWGWQTAAGETYLWTRRLSTRDFAKATGLAIDHIARDLRTLIARRVLLERDGCYHFVADVHKWLPVPNGPADPSPHAADRAADAAEIASSAPVAKTGKIDRNVPLGLSTVVDNWPPPGGASPEMVDRVVAVVTAFVGALSLPEAEALRRWICAEGIAAVWGVLEPSLRRGLPDARRRLAERAEETGD